jgi:hypothetical protein
MYYALIKTHPDKNFWSTYTDDNGLLIQNSSFYRMYKECASKYGVDKVKILEDVTYKLYPPERIEK